METKIYFAYDEKTNRVKIGISRDVETRLETLKQEYGQLKLLGVMDGDFGVEKELHQKFEKFNYIGEWFNLSAEILNFIAISADRAMSQICSLEYADFNSCVNPFRMLIKLNDIPMGYAQRKSGLSHNTILSIISSDGIPRETRIETLDKLAAALGYQVKVELVKVNGE